MSSLAANSGPGGAGGGGDNLRSARVYGNWRKPQSPGLFGLGSLGTALLIVGLILVIFVVMVSGSLIQGAVTGAILGVVLLAIVRKDKHGRNALVRGGARGSWWLARRRGAHLYRSGPLGRTPWGTYQLPGLAAPLRLSEHEDSYGRRFGLLYCPQTRTYTVVIGAEPEGVALVDPDEIDNRVADWGAWLASLGDEPGVEAASVTIETAPDSGARLRREVAGRLDPDAPDFARQVLTETVTSSPVGSSTVRAYIAVTFSAVSRLDGRRRKDDEMGRDLAARVPGLTGRLEATGAGAARPLTAQRLCEVVRIAYEPSAAAVIDEAYAAGEPIELQWPDAGPAAAQATWDAYRHDDAWSVTWAMSDAPRGHVRDNVLNRLLRPHPDIARKRVTLLYRPIDPARAAGLVESDARAAEFRVTASTKPSARDSLALRHAAAHGSRGGRRRRPGQLRDGHHRHGARPRPSAPGPGDRRLALVQRAAAPADGLRSTGLRVRCVSTAGPGPAASLEDPHRHSGATVRGLPRTSGGSGGNRRRRELAPQQTGRRRRREAAPPRARVDLRAVDSARGGAGGGAEAGVDLEEAESFSPTIAPTSETPASPRDRPARLRRLRKMARGGREGAVRRPGPRGWLGRGAGESVLVDPPPEWRGTTVQVCGLWPFGIGAGTPVVGVPLGRHLMTGAAVCCDPISWFQRARLIRNPSMFVLGLPGLGKSTLVRRILIGLSGYGTIPLVLGDVRPDYVDVIEALGGDVIRLGGARGYLNPLDNTEAVEAAGQLERAAVAAGQDGGSAEDRARFLKARDEMLADAKARRAALVTALITIARGGAVSAREDNIINAALDELDTRTARGAGSGSGSGPAPVLEDLLAVVKEAPPALRVAAVDRDDLTRYQVITEELEASLIGLVRGGTLGQTFSRQTSKPMRRDRPVVFDLSGIQDTEPKLRAATLMACWSTGFGTVNVAQALATAGLEPQRHYIIAMDEIHQALRSGPGMVERYDQLTRLNRKYGVGQIMITHTMHDLYALPTEEDREKARGLVERSGLQVLGGLPGAEMPLLTGVVPLSREEQALLNKWQEPPSWDPETGSEASPPGLGNFLIKVGGRPGIPFQVKLTAAERYVHDTNRLWKTESRIGLLADRVVEQVADRLHEQTREQTDPPPTTGPDGLVGPGTAAAAVKTLQSLESNDPTIHTDPTGRVAPQAAPPAAPQVETGAEEVS